MEDRGEESRSQTAPFKKMLNAWTYACKNSFSCGAGKAKEETRGSRLARQSSGRSACKSPSAVLTSQSSGRSALACKSSSPSQRKSVRFMVPSAKAGEPRTTEQLIQQTMVDLLADSKNEMTKLDERRERLLIREKLLTSLVEILASGADISAHDNANIVGHESQEDILRRFSGELAVVKEDLHLIDSRIQLLEFSRQEWNSIVVMMNGITVTSASAEMLQDLIYSSTLSRIREKKMKLGGRQCSWSTTCEVDITGELVCSLSAPTPDTNPPETTSCLPQEFDYTAVVRPVYTPETVEVSTASEHLATNIEGTPMCEGKRSQSFNQPLSASRLGNGSQTGRDALIQQSLKIAAWESDLRARHKLHKNDQQPARPPTKLAASESADNVSRLIQSEGSPQEHRTSGSGLDSRAGILETDPEWMEALIQDWRTEH